MANETRIEHASETWLADSTVFEVNRVPAHSDHKCYAHDSQTNEWSDLRQSLDGEWRVEVVQASDIEFNEEPFVRENFDDSAFERIQVPGHLQMAGLMNNKYVNIQYPWDGHENPAEPNIPENNHVALYRKTFTMANRLADTKNAGGTVSIVFHGMATAIYVWVNGMFVGYGEDGFTPNEFDITEMLHDGENVVAVACYEYSSASCSRTRTSGVCTDCSARSSWPRSRMCISRTCRSNPIGIRSPAAPLWTRRSPCATQPTRPRSRRR